MDGFGSSQGIKNFMTLWMLKENAQSLKVDWMEVLMPISSERYKPQGPRAEAKASVLSEPARISSPTLPELTRRHRADLTM